MYSEVWLMPIQQVFDYYKTSEKGLSDTEASSRVKEYGLNEIAEKERRHWLEIFVSQFTNALVLVLIVAAVLSYFLKERIDAVVILSIILLNSMLGFYQEYRAEKTVAALKKYVTYRAKVLRNDEIVEIDSKDVVPGDIVFVTIGDLIPADMRLFRLEDFSTEESSLTGESLPVSKSITEVKEGLNVQDYSNMAFMGTSAVTGSAWGIVTATGKNTFFGKTTALLEGKPEEADFQKNIKKFSNMLLKVIIIMTIFIFGSNALLGKGIFDSFLFAIALAVGMTPEVLPIIMTITLSRGALKMASEQVITKKLVSVEDFGNIDTLCCDKTGTLTEGVLTLADYVGADSKKDDDIVVYGMVCTSVTGKRKSFGNPLDAALWQSDEGINLKSEADSYVIIDVNEFDFERRRMSVLATKNEKNILVCKGAPESILEICTSIDISGEKKVFSKNEIENEIFNYEKEGYRVIAVAYKDVDKSKNESTKADEKELTFKGLLFFLDPPKKTAGESLNTLQNLGVTIKVISGDSPVITRKICGDVNLSLVDNRVITGRELEALNDMQFKEYSLKYNVFARVTPEQKYKIVKSLKREGHITGFLGDGINDAPALKAADVGISVDSAAGVAKEVADIILLNKSLRVLAHGIIEGRKTFGNITKYILNTTSANYGNMVTVALSSLFLGFIPLLPPQILLNNFISDVPLITISTDNVDADLLKKPRKWDIKHISRFMIYFGALSSFFDLILIASLLYVVRAQPELFRTAWFVLSALSEMVVTFAIRTRLPFFKSRPSTWLIVTSGLAGITALFVTYTWFGGLFFQFVKIPLPVLGLITGILLAYFVSAEILKKYFFERIDAY